MPGVQAQGAGIFTWFAIKGKPLMPSSPQLRGADLDAVVAYVRSLSEPSSQHKE